VPFLVDMTFHLNNFNKELQGKDKLNTDIYDNIKAFKINTTTTMMAKKKRKKKIMMMMMIIIIIIIHLRFVHSTVVFLHPKLSFAICLCL
jgi:t-SNARE complex subunit (syntaxin)